ncbi:MULTISPECIES: hypothetical protein [Burkholderia]|uniref:hypothetical protein n=1 Tax=Burkholderia TaxID=32008 RepID=UPI000398B8C9|nr:MULTISPECIES: hypothetical protein [Burkholderia]ERJ35081.1 hypothetical protein L810_2225 [Burkholderia sp. AU4i]KVV20452.1 hypothetical protein WK78_29680 [Burkholderia cepacia]
MKRLYARLVLWLIGPALEDIERRMVERVEREAVMRADGDMALRSRFDSIYWRITTDRDQGAIGPSFVQARKRSDA